jgi:hypothetical protein
VRQHRQELAFSVLGVVPVASELAALICRCQVAHQRIDDRQLGGAETLLRARGKHDGTEQFAADRERGDDGAREAEIAKCRRPRVRIVCQRFEDQRAALSTPQIRGNGTDRCGRQRGARQSYHRIERQRAAVVHRDENGHRVELERRR